MTLIFGLGNPGKKFEKTRHNIGFEALNRFARAEDFPAFSQNKKLKAKISEAVFGNTPVILVKPQTFMNKSGLAVKKTLSFYKKVPSKIVIVHDDIDIPLGSAKVSKNRGAAGHNGVSSVIEKIKTKDFYRIRVGIKKEGMENIKRESFVLSGFSGEKEFNKATEIGCSCLKTFLTLGPAGAEKQFNHNG